MKNSKNIFTKKKEIALILMVAIFLVGISLAVWTFTESREAIIREHDSHLFDLADSVDHSINEVLSRCRSELAVEMESEDFRTVEEQYLAGDEQSLQNLIDNYMYYVDDNLLYILVYDDSGVLMSSNKAPSAESYAITRNSKGGDVSLFRDEAADISYLAITRTSPESGLTYAVLFNCDLFYNRVVADNISDGYWIVLYDLDCSLVLHNSTKAPSSMIVSRDEISGRRDGFSLLMNLQDGGERGSDTYFFTEEGSGKRSARMAVIPSSKTENGAFAVAAAVYGEDLIDPAQSRFGLMIAACAIICLSAASFIFFLLHSRRREQEMADELADLEKKNELTSELLRQQEELVHHQKLETIGTLTAGIAHEFNNLLSPIMGNSLLILEKTPDENSEIYDNALGIYQSSARAKQLISKISGLSRRNPAETMKPLSPAALIDGVQDVIRASLPVNVNVEKNILTDSVIFGNESQLGHMLLNLAINGAQAMNQDGGTLTMSAYEDDGSVCLAVADTGSGIAPENLEKLFDPFFTTKEAGKGTGLGLAIAMHTATTHGGTITAENRPEGGAVFTVHLPVYKGNTEL